jgi:Porin-like glycoporin RafY
MNRSHVTRLAAAVLALAAAPAFAEFNANIEFDNTYANNGRGLSQGGRVELNAVAKGIGANDAFVAGKASFIAGRSGSTGTDDMWVQLGNNAMDVKLGRFEAADVFRRGRDTVVDVAGSGYTYRANMLRGRTANGFHGAFNANLGGGLGAELGVIEAKSGTNGTFSSVGGATPFAAKGVRPVVYYKDESGLSGLVSAEFGKATSSGTEESFNGFGLSVGVPMGGMVLTLNGASGKIDNAASRSHTVGLTAAFGAFEAAFETGKSFSAEKISTVYASYQTGLFDIKNATITPAVSYSTLKDAPAGTPDNNAALRVRINYAF